MDILCSGALFLVKVGVAWPCVYRSVTGDTTRHDATLRLAAHCGVSELDRGRGPRAHTAGPHRRLAASISADRCAGYAVGDEITSSRGQAGPRLHHPGTVIAGGGRWRLFVKSEKKQSVG